MPPRRVEPGPGQESVWDYPRPPRAEPCAKPVEVWFNGVPIAHTTRAVRVLETSHPPVYYIPAEDVRREYLKPTGRGSYCEFKGSAAYFTVSVNGREAADVAWSYPSPTPAFASIAGHLAFYAGPMDRCLVGGEEVEPQPGGFYGGWVTNDVVGPFKGGPGTMGW